MYSVSARYKENMKAPAQKFDISGTVGSHSFGRRNLLPTGAFTITDQCSDDSQLTLGSVYVGELRASFIDIPINRYEWVGLKITPNHIRLYDDGTHEDVPLGVYTIDSAEWCDGIISVIAYDNMSKLDKRVSLSTTTGKAFDFLSYICTECNVPCGMTRAEIEAFPNGNVLLGLYTENDIETYRDMLSWLAQTLAGYATCDRTGAIVIRSFNMDVVDTIQPDERFTGGSYADYETRYSGISVVSIKDKTTRYYSTAEDNYLTYNLGSNPFLQYSSRSTLDVMCNDILNSLAAVRYVPFNATMIGDPAYDLGDVIVLAGGYGDSSKYFCIHRYTYTFQQSYEAAGVGENPALANARSKTDKDIAGLMSQTSSNTFQYYIFRNIEAIEIGDSRTKEIINVRFASLTSTIVIMEAEILLDIDTTDNGNTYTDAVGTITYYRDGSEDLQYHPTETWVDGDHILHLLYHINIGEGQMNRFVATLTMNGGSAYIAPQGVQASIHGQGLAAIGEWDGYLDFEETLSEITLGSITVENNIIDTLTAWTDIPYSPALAETLGEITLGGITVEGNFSEMLLVDKDAMSNYTHQDLTPYTHEDLHDSFIHG